MAGRDGTRHGTSLDDSNGRPARSRPALAAAVGLACALAGFALVTLLGGGEGTQRLATASAAATPGTAALHPERLARAGHGTSVPGMTERQLRAFESATLGPAHAKEHAVIRAAIRRRDEIADEIGPSRPMATTADADAAAVGDASEVGAWETGKTVFDVVAIHAALLPTGKVMIFSYPTNPVRENYSRAYLWNPADGSIVEKDPPDMNGHPANIWCAGQTFTADGELLVFGGNLEFPNDEGTTTWKGLDRVYTFNPFTETWREQPKMEHGRWYPTGIRMANGRVPIISGLDESGTVPSVINKDVELFTPPATIGGEGTIKKIGETSYTDPTKPPVGDLYPRMFAMPDGKVMIAGPDPYAWAFTNITDSGFSWTDIPDLSRFRIWGSTVLVPGDASGSTRLLALGGTDYSGKFAAPDSESFDESNPSAPWKAAPSNIYGRGHANTVLLPDGSMVEVGGGVGANNDTAVTTDPLHYALPETRHIELWDKHTGQWKLGPEQTEARAYHSTALLLPDGRVMSAGDESNGDGDPAHVDTAELYEPPYLHRGPRPQISSVSDQIQAGAGFGVTTPDTNIAGASLVAPGAVTHGVDMNQRVIQLDVTHGTGCVSLRAPAANVAPPGYYMLFLLNDQGVPSVAKFVKLQASASPDTCDAAPPPEPTPKPTPKPTPTPTPTPKPVPAQVDPTPELSRLKLSHGRFRKGATTTISFRLNEAAKVSLTVEAKLPGRKVRGRCVKPGKHAKPNCSRYVRVHGGLTFSGRAGTNRVSFRGKLGKRSLATGSYRLTLLAKDSTGDWSTPISASFKLLERASKRDERAAQAALLAWF